MAFQQGKIKIVSNLGFGDKNNHWKRILHIFTLFIHRLDGQYYLRKEKCLVKSNSLAASSYYFFFELKYWPEGVNISCVNYKCQRPYECNENREMNENNINDISEEWSTAFSKIISSTHEAKETPKVFKYVPIPQPILILQGPILSNYEGFISP